jgi:hypothetical protein
MYDVSVLQPPTAQSDPPFPSDFPVPPARPKWYQPIHNNKEWKETKKKKHIPAEPFWAPPSFSRIGRRADIIIPRSIKVVTTGDDAMKSQAVAPCGVSRELFARMVVRSMVLDERWGALRRKSKAGWLIPGDW